MGTVGEKCGDKQRRARLWRTRKIGQTERIECMAVLMSILRSGSYESIERPATPLFSWFILGLAFMISRSFSLSDRNSLKVKLLR